MVTTETTTASELDALLGRVNGATKLLQRSATAPAKDDRLVDSFERTLGAAAPLRLEADPYLTTTLWPHVRWFGAPHSAAEQWKATGSYDPFDDPIATRW
jgi:hypothetical protein